MDSKARNALYAPKVLAVRQQMITSTVLALAVRGNMPDRRVKLFEGAGKFSIAR